MSKLIFITGGARSGKSQLAQQLACGLNREAHPDGIGVTYVATAQALDPEMKVRIKIHQKNRPADWRTIERTRDIGGVLSQLSDNSYIILLDCLTMLISNLLLSGESEKAILEEVNRIGETSKAISPTVLVVSNEVRMGIVPDNSLGRTFRDLAGRANQIMAKEADEVYFVVSGIGNRIK
jgi:adenosylcobinamide kinase/adenosylcobinamide-phosphate guanylyltransferase